MHSGFMACYMVLHLWRSLAAGDNCLPLCSELFFSRGADITNSNVVGWISQKVLFLLTRDSAQRTETDLHEADAEKFGFSIVCEHIYLHFIPCKPEVS